MQVGRDNTRFEEQYLSLRRKEGRLYTDDEVVTLPNIRATHPLKKEWNIRKESCNRLAKYLRKKKRPLRVLEVGSGNGWLCHQLSKIPQTTVEGIDINATELLQAKRVFPAIHFSHTRIENLKAGSLFDTIVFAASFQYFPSAKETIPGCFSLLKGDGEVHIIDTFFYSEEEALRAAGRSLDHFATLGFAEMSQFYFHHSWQELSGFRYDVLFDPGRFYSRIFNKSPFPWIRIKQ